MYKYNSAKKWKNKQIKQLKDLQDEMTTHNIDPSLIKEYLDEEYEKIQEEYKKKIYESKKKVSKIKIDVYNKILYEMKNNNYNSTESLEFID
jgi:hypothetical protein